jgi:hypothetical protein
MTFIETPSTVHQHVRLNRLHGRSPAFPWSALDNQTSPSNSQALPVAYGEAVDSFGKGSRRVGNVSEVGIKEVVTMAALSISCLSPVRLSAHKTFAEIVHSQYD